MTPNPNGVPQPPMLKLKRKNCPGNVEPRWGSEDFVRFFLGCAVVTATPGFVVKPRWGWVRMEKMWVMSRDLARTQGQFELSVSTRNSNVLEIFSEFENNS